MLEFVLENPLVPKRPPSSLARKWVLPFQSVGPRMKPPRGVHPAVVLAFEEMRTPHASRREICIQKFGNAYQRNETEKRTTHLKAPFHWIPLFAYAVRIASMILRTARSIYVIYAEICVNAARIICMPSVCLSTRLSPSLTPHPPLPQSSRVHSTQARVRAQNWRIEKGESSAQWKSAINRIKVPQRDLRMAKVITFFTALQYPVQLLVADPAFQRDHHWQRRIDNRETSATCL